VLLNSATDLGVGPSIAELEPRLDEGVVTMNSAMGLENELVFLIFLSAYWLAGLQFYFVYHITLLCKYCKYSK